MKETFGGTGEASRQDHEQAVDRLLDVARGRRLMVAFTGAGISTDSGIPDYRGPGGVWETGKPPTLGDFLENPATRRAYWENRRESYPDLAAKTPNSGHLALAAMERAGVLQAVITQNIDGLHQKAGNDPARVIELHGSAHRVRCLACGRIFDAWSIWRRQRSGEIEPSCEVCGGALRSATVLFGEPLPKAALDVALRAAQACDLMLVVGSSLVVNPAARLPVIAKRQGAALAIINRTATPLDALADAHVSGDAGPVLSDLAAAVAATISADRGREGRAADPG
ncbi:MAG: SIR2 family NAD-dependent protein deacylase [Thermomicrobiales bacterium]